MRHDRFLSPADLLPKIDRLFDLSAAKIRALEAAWRPEDGAPVFTVGGRWQSRGWTEWTQGFQFGSAVLQFDATGDREFLELARDRTIRRMAPHLTHVGVHDHGFNNVSTYGGLWRLAGEGRIDAPEWETRFYELALKVSGAVQASRWTPLPDGGYIYSFNGAHSLFVDTIRSLRALALSHQLGHRLLEEQDASVSLLGRLIDHARATARYSVYYGKGRDSYDLRGRVAHESLFNAANGTYRGPNSQQGYRRFRRGRGAWPGRCSALPNSSSFSAPSALTNLWTSVDAQESNSRCSTRRVRRATSTLTRRRPLMACPTGIPERPASPRLATGRNAPPTPSTIVSRWTAPPPRLGLRACSDSDGCSRLAARTVHATNRQASWFSRP